MEIINTSPAVMSHWCKPESSESFTSRAFPKCLTSVDSYAKSPAALLKIKDNPASNNKENRHRNFVQWTGSARSALTSVYQTFSSEFSRSSASPEHLNVYHYSKNTKATKHMSSRAAFWCTVKWPVITKSTESSGFVLRRGKRNHQSNSRGCLPPCSVISSPRFNAKHRVTVMTAGNDQLLENPQGCIKKPKQLFQVCHVLFVARSWGALTSQHNLRWSVSLLVTS